MGPPATSAGTVNHRTDQRLFFAVASRPYTGKRFEKSLATDKIQDIDYRNVEQLGLDAEDRNVYYDLYCHCSDGKDFIVEMQRRSQKYYRERMVFYSTYPIQQQCVNAPFDGG